VTLAIKPPPGVAEDEFAVSAFVGRPGGESREVEFGRDSRKRVTITLEDHHPPQEAFTVDLAWPSGYGSRPSAIEASELFWADNQPILFAAVGAPVVFAYFLAVWFAFGRDPKRGLVVPLFYPPEGVSPAMARFLIRRGTDQKTLSAAVANLAARKLITFKRRDDAFLIEKTVLGHALADYPHGPAGAVVPLEEREVMSSLFGRMGSFSFEPANASAVWHAINSLDSTLKSVAGERWLKLNRPAFVPGLVLSIIGFVLTGMAADVTTGVGGGADAGPNFFAYALMTFVSTGAMLAAGAYTLASWRNFMQGARVLKALVILTGWNALLAVTAAFVVFWLYKGVLVSSLVVVPLFVALLVVNAAFYRLLTVCTPEGRLILDELEGFRMYLAAAEGPEMVEAAPEKTPELFRRYLPYAMAMDVESKWAARFSETVLDVDAYSALFEPADNW
jgi:hypothetical protein